MCAQVENAECVEIMTKILNETFDVLELDPFYTAFVPMHHKGYIDNVIFAGKGSVASYAAHFPSSHQHYKSKQLVDTRALNGFVVRKARELNTPAPINECAPPLHPARAPRAARSHACALCWLLHRCPAFVRCA